jgi:hypothetical protein
MRDTGEDARHRCLLSRGQQTRRGSRREKKGVEARRRE